MEILEKNKNLLSLKEAALLSGYSADYLGQLIRAGKIAGKQVYCNVQWMTTSEAVMDYKNKGKNVDSGASFKSGWRKLAMEFDIVKLFFKTFRSAFPLFALILVCSILLVSFISNMYFKNINEKNYQSQNQKAEIKF
jgi:hypothetical protein